MSMHSNYRQAAQVLLDSGYSCYLVGGAVRDIMLGIEPDDYDLATNATPDEMIAAFQRVGMNTYPTGIDHGTITVVLSGEPIEITTFRTEGDYTDGRRPDSVSFVADIVPDLARRDFTINAMAINLADGSLTDPFSGREDLEAGVIRAVGNAQDRLLEDGLRAYRACRQAAKFNFEIDDELLMALQETEITQPAVERINTEFTKGILYDKPSIMLNYLALTGLLDSVVADYPTNVLEIGENLDRMRPSLEARLAVFLEPVKDKAEEVLSYLKYPNRVTNKVMKYLDNYPYTVDDPTRLVRNVGRESKDDILNIHKIETDETTYSNTEQHIQYILDHNVPLNVKDLDVGGEDVIALGIPQSRLVGTILNELLERVLEDPSIDQREELERIVNEYT